VRIGILHIKEQITLYSKENLLNTKNRQCGSWEISLQIYQMLDPRIFWLSRGERDGLSTSECRTNFIDE
jgi:hypothetical protein